MLGLEFYLRAGGIADDGVNSVIALHLASGIPDAVGSGTAGYHSGGVDGQETARGVSGDTGEAHYRAGWYGDIPGGVEGADFFGEEGAEL